MAKHNVYVSLPWRELGKEDVIFNVYTDGKKAGTVTISKGAIEWYPANAKKPYKMGWARFDRAIKEHYGHSITGYGWHIMDFKSGQEK